MENNGYEVDDVSNANIIAGNSANSNIQNINITIQGQGQAQDHGRVPYVLNGVWYPGTPNNVSSHVQGQVPYVHNGVWYPVKPKNVTNQDHGQVPYVHTADTPNNLSGQDHGGVPYVHNGVWYPGNPNNVSNLQRNYTYPGQDHGLVPYVLNGVWYPRTPNNVSSHVQGQVPYVHNGVWYPVKPKNVTNQDHGQVPYVHTADTPNNLSGQDHGRVPYVHNGVWYPGNPNNVSNLQRNYTYPNPPPAMDMGMNGYDGGYYEPGTPYGGYYRYYNHHAVSYIPNHHYYHPPANGCYQLQQQELQPQLPRRPLFEEGRRGSFVRNSNGRYSNTLGGRGRGLSTNNNNTSSSQVMGNIAERLMRMAINEGQRSAPLQDQAEGHAERHEHAHAEAAARFSREYPNAKFFIIKSCSRENLVSSMQHGVWTSTHRGNRILDAPYREAHQDPENANTFCPVFLFFAVRGGGNFCGVAEMDGPVDFEASADCWDLEWKGKFPVKWHIIKDVPYNQFQHITFNSVEKIPIIYSRDAEKVEFEKGVEMLDIFNSYVVLLEDVSMLTASSHQQSPRPSPHHHEVEEEKQKQKKEDEEEKGEKECEQSCSGSSSCDTNTDQTEHDPIENSRTEMQLKEIVDTDETQQTDVDSSMKQPKTNVDKEQTHQPSAETNYGLPKTTTDTHATTKVTEDSTVYTKQILTSP